MNRYSPDVARMHVQSTVEQIVVRLRGLPITINAITAVVFSYIRNVQPELLEVLKAEDVKLIVEEVAS